MYTFEDMGILIQSLVKSGIVADLEDTPKFLASLSSEEAEHLMNLVLALEDNDDSMVSNHMSNTIERFSRMTKLLELHAKYNKASQAYLDSWNELVDSVTK